MVILNKSYKVIKDDAAKEHAVSYLPGRPGGPGGPGGPGTKTLPAPYCPTAETRTHNFK